MVAEKDPKKARMLQTKSKSITGKGMRKIIKRAQAKSRALVPDRILARMTGKDQTPDNLGDISTGSGAGGSLSC